MTAAGSRRHSSLWSLQVAHYSVPTPWAQGWGLLGTIFSLGLWGPEVAVR